MNAVGLSLEMLDTPALWVDLDTLEANIAKLAAHFKNAGVGWRPHTKGIKSSGLAHKLLRAGAFGVTCARLSEAEAMAAAGIRDILIGNQVTSARKLQRLAHVQRMADVKVCVDNADVVRATGAAASAAGTTIGVLVELNTGMERAGAMPGQPALAIARVAADTPGVALRGIMTWEGHAIGAGDEAAKGAAVQHSLGLALETAELLRSDGLVVEIVSAGGSGTYHHTPFVKGVTEIEAGGAIYGDAQYQAWNVESAPALFVRSTVTSRPTPTRIITDCGFKAMGRAFASPVPQGISDVTSVALSAEHGIITLDKPNNHTRPGDVLDLLVSYSDATVYAHEVMYGVRKGVVEAVWQIVGRAG